MSLESWLREFEEAASKATRGKWEIVAWEEPLDEVGHLFHGLQVQSLDGQEVIAVVHTGASAPPAQALADAEFIARARTAVPRLIAVCRILALVIKLREMYNQHVKACWDCGRWGEDCDIAEGLYYRWEKAYDKARGLVEMGELPE